MKSQYRGLDATGVKSPVADVSILRNSTKNVPFRVTDSFESVPVAYAIILPDLFREGQGVVAEGTFGSDHVFAADTVLAKHDENYMPKEVVDDLKARGLWEDGKGMVNGGTVDRSVEDGSAKGASGGPTASSTPASGAVVAAGEGA